MKVIFIILSMLLPVVTYAQSITGKLIDAQNQPVPFANVIVLSADSTFITGNVSGEDGTFQVETTKNAALLKISYIGFEDQVLPIQNRTDMGVIQLREEATALGEVVVKGTLPVTKIKGDAMVTGIENTVLAKVGSANDVLQKIPGVTKDGDTYEVFGKGEPLIYINGREVMNKEELERLNSDEIRKAVIRIQTVKRQGDGFAFDLRSSYYQSQNTDLIEQWDFNYRHNDLDVFLNGYYMRREQENVLDEEQMNRVEDIWNQTNYINEKHLINNLNAIIGFNYTPKENHSFGMQYDISGYLDYYYDNIASNNVFLNGEYYDKLNNQAHSNYADHLSHTLNGYYNGKINNLGINLNVDYFKQSYKLETTTTENSQDREDREIRSQNPVDNQLAAAKLVFEHPLFGGNLSFGSEYTYTLRTDDYLSFSEAYIPTSYSKIREHNIAAFLEYQYHYLSDNFPPVCATNTTILNITKTIRTAPTRAGRMITSSRMPLSAQKSETYSYKPAIRPRQTVRATSS